MRWTICLAAAAVAFSAGGTALSARTGAKEGFGKIQKIAKEGDPDLIDVVIPAKLVDDRDLENEDVIAWQEAFAKKIAAAKVVSAREAGEEGVVRVKDGRSELEIVLRFTGRRWVVDCADPYLVRGKLIDAANGGSPALVRLEVRKDSASYGKGAFSFAHATTDPKDCKNRMAVWYCKYGSLHTVGDERIADLGKVSLSKVTGLEPGLTWVEEVAPEKGHCYVIHCYGKGRKDFYVKLLVTAVDESSLTFEWSLLAMGRGAPTKIHEPVPIPASNLDGADGTAGYCGAHGKSSTRRK